MSVQKYNPITQIRWFETADHTRTYAYLLWDKRNTALRDSIVNALSPLSLESLRGVELPFGDGITRKCYVITVNKEAFQAQFPEIQPKITTLNFSEEGMAVTAAPQPEAPKIDIRKASDSIPFVRFTEEQSKPSSTHIKRDSDCAENRLHHPLKKQRFKTPSYKAQWHEGHIGKNRLPPKKRLLLEYLAQQEEAASKGFTLK